MKRAFFVIGSEGSGTNMLAEAFVSAGCYYNPKHNSHLNNYEFEKMPSPFVFRRSLPHAHEWPEPRRIRIQMEKAKFEVTPIFIIRDWFCTVSSVIRRTQPVDVVGKSVIVEDNMRYAFQIVSDEKLYDLIYVSYESFCLHPEFRRWLFVERLGLKEPTIEIKYANPKYYD
ncbi:MAG: hypothetical protein KAJ19_14350 [Gammaproteobacteria bacterium]|nr:hypothetical protein [Gammaproteobacteria bacterium]